jgi:DNA-binding MarR family transcriptional regulator
MAARRTPPSPARAELVQTLDAAGRELSTAAVMFHTALAARQGLNATEEKSLDLLDRFGPLTAGEIGQRTGLAPASVTGLIDRLERKGFARRIKDPQDGRRVLVELDRGKAQAFLPLFSDFVGSLHELYARYSVEQLELLLGFLRELTRRQEAARVRLAEPGAAGPPRAAGRRR